MKSCICTIIKDEHQYLDEWITYHLNIGVTHIFIFEDVDSKSHKRITDKYKDNVSLFKVSILFKKNENGIISDIKEKKIRGHLTYFKRALNYIKENHPEYDWCFLIDVDEFITFEDDGYTLDTALSKFEGYDAFIVKWKCFGANGLIKKPDYKDKGVVDTFTKPIAGYILDNPASFNKTCYNLKMLNDDIYLDHHLPSKDCNWVNTDFKKDKPYKCYKILYLRHYITKSWEEYVWKKNCRGFLWGKGGRKDFNFFFEANPELKSEKNKLIKEIEKQNK